MILDIRIDKTISGLHGNLIFEIPLANVYRKLDLYYFSLSSDSSSSELENDPLIMLVKYWLTEIKKLEKGNSIFLPIDFSDQYTGCLKVESISPKTMVVTYGFSMIPGYSISSSDPSSYYTDMDDFVKYVETQSIEICTDDLERDLLRIIENLKQQHN